MSGTVPSTGGEREPLDAPVPLPDNSSAGTANGSRGLLGVVKDISVKNANSLLGSLLQNEQYVGETWEVDYREVSVQVHDKFRKIAGGIPMGCFLVATRLKPGADIEDWNGEDTALVLLRVKGRAALWNAAETTKIRIEAGQRATGEQSHWDAEENMDAYTHQAFAYGGLQCSILGTYYLQPKPGAADKSELKLTFGSDIANFYPNRGMKVYKPVGNALQTLLNFRDETRYAEHPLGAHTVEVGRVRYSSTERTNKGLDGVKIFFSPVDILGAKTALFGMTRIGKSNTTKVIAKSVYEIRTKKGDDGQDGPRVGQLVFDVNGEYANENFQDVTGKELPSALRNVYKLGGSKDDVVVYGQSRPDHDPERKVTKINFYDAGDMLNVGKQLIHEVLEEQGNPPQYVRSFVAMEFEDPGPGYGGAQTRFKRQLLAYHALLKKAGFEVPAGFQPDTTKLFGDILDLMKMPNTLNTPPENPDEKTKKQLESMKTQVFKEDLKGQGPEQYLRAARTFENPQPSWTELGNAFEVLNEFIQTKTFKRWDDDYSSTSSSGMSWADPMLHGILGMFRHGAYKIMKEAAEWHKPDESSDYVNDIYEHLEKGRLVIVDQSIGDPELNARMAERIAKRIFQGNSKKFATGKVKAHDMSMLLYVEEAHNLLPDSSNKDVKNIWSRIVKEGGKFGIGVVYATQEPSSIQRNILQNTANWFVGHLSSTDEAREVSKHYDFKDYEESILQAQDRGFMRVRMQSNGFTVPVQIEKFAVPV